MLPVEDQAGNCRSFTVTRQQVPGGPTVIGGDEIGGEQPQRRIERGLQGLSCERDSDESALVINQLSTHDDGDRGVGRRVRGVGAGYPVVAKVGVDILVGFPGETDADFEQLLDFITEAKLDRVGCFQYSAVEGASANDLPGHVPEDVMAERERLFMEKQAAISRERLQAKIGSTQLVLVDAVGDDYAVGRSHADAPEIDGLVVVEEELPVGDMVPVLINGALAYDLTGTSVFARHERATQP